MYIRKENEYSLDSSCLLAYKLITFNKCQQILDIYYASPVHTDNTWDQLLWYSVKGTDLKVRKISV
jgi:hypothetical protein